MLLRLQHTASGTPCLFLRLLRRGHASSTAGSPRRSRATRAASTRLAEPLLRLLVRWRIARDYRRLKALLESG
jgi:hypothetical protein